jgi:proton-coupled amino acid transporter
VALAGMLAIGLAVGVVLYYCIHTRLMPYGVPEGAWLHAPWSTLPVAFGVNVYLFEGIGLILPLESKMERPKAFVGIMWGVHLSVATAVASFGLVGYLAFYNCTLAPIIGNMPCDGALIAVTVWGLNVCLLFTYPIQMVPVFQILEDLLLVPSRRGETAVCCGYRHRVLEAQPRCAPCWSPDLKFTVKAMVLRAAVVVVSVAFAISIPYFDSFLSLIGGLGSAQLMFILPPISYLVCFRGQLSWGMRIACFAMVLFGVGTLVVTTVFTVIQIVQQFELSAAGGAGLCNVTYSNFTIGAGLCNVTDSNFTIAG